MTKTADLMEGLHAAMTAGRRVRLRLDDGRGGMCSARIFVGVPSAVGPWGPSNTPHVVVQMRGAHGTMVAVAVQLDRVVAVEPLDD